MTDVGLSAFYDENTATNAADSRKLSLEVAPTT